MAPIALLQLSLCLPFMVSSLQRFTQVELQSVIEILSMIPRNINWHSLLIYGPRVLSINFVIRNCFHFFFISKKHDVRSNCWLSFFCLNKSIKMNYTTTFWKTPALFDFDDKVWYEIDRHLTRKNKNFQANWL